MDHRPPPPAPPAPKRRIPDWAWILGAVVLGLAAIAYIGVTDGFDTDTATDDPGADTATPAAATGEPVTLSGEGQVNTDPLDLTGGTYSVQYSYTGSCYYAAALVPIDPGLFEFSVDLAAGDGPVDGDTNVYDVEPGSYYVRTITGPAPGCPWEITLTPA